MATDTPQPSAAEVLAVLLALTLLGFGVLATLVYVVSEVVSHG